MTSERPTFVPADVPDEAVAWWLETVGGRMAALRADAEALGLIGMVDQVDALRSDMHGRTEAALRAQGVFDPLDESRRFVPEPTDLGSAHE
jgi:hypothetical protein